MLPIDHISVRSIINNRVQGWGRRGSIQYQWSIAVDRETKDILGRLSIHPRKSKSTFVPSVPLQFVVDYVRGVVEGDGSFALCKRYKYNRYQLSIVSASERFVRGLAAMIDSYLPRVKSSFYQQKGTKCWYVRYQTRDTTRIHNWLYPDSLPIGLSLSRKRYV